MKRFLYITPYFPPQTRVGALRPLKFVRHLPDFGWAPVVLADLGRGDAIDQRLYDLVPDSCKVVWDYSSRAAGTWQALEQRQEGEISHRSREISLIPRMVGRVIHQIASVVPQPNPEFLPLGEHSPRMLHALRSGRRLLERYPCEAIMVNADPYAACLVGRRLGEESGLPVIQDLRDPWALCDMRRPRRPAPQRRLVDWMERICVEDCARFVLNTRTACEQYRAHYTGIPPERFDFIRNHSDAEIISGGDHVPRQRYTLLFLGGFRRFVKGHVMIEVLAELRRRGHPERDLALMVTGRLSDDAKHLARRLGVEGMLEDHPFVPYREVGTFMKTADLLVALSTTGSQRFPAKVFDYATSSRPLLVVTDSPELEEMLGELGGAYVHGMNDVVGIADTVEEEMRLGRRRSLDRSKVGLDSATASEKLARILDEVTEEKRLC